jgi:integrase
MEIELQPEDALAGLGGRLALGRVINDVMPLGAPMRIDGDLLEAYEAASAPNAIRALQSDLRAFGDWCREQSVVSLPASGQLIASYLEARSAGGSAPASLARYKASIARLHLLLGLSDPTREPVVTLKLRAIRRQHGVVQRQARPLRFKGAVRDVHADAPRGLSLSALLDSCSETLIGHRDRALLSMAYDTGLRAAELVAATVADVQGAIDPDAGLLRIRRSKSDQAGEGATAYLSPRSMRALAAWCQAAGIETGPLFRRVHVRALPARAAIPGERWARIESGVLRHGRAVGTAARAAGHVLTVGDGALTPGAVTGIYRRLVARAYAAGFLPDLSDADLAGWLTGLSAHSTRVGLTQDLFTAGEDLAGIMDALRWKTPRMPLLYNRNLAAESGAAGRVVGRL